MNIKKVSKIFLPWTNNKIKFRRKNRLEEISNENYGRPNLIFDDVEKIDYMSESDKRSMKKSLFSPMRGMGFYREPGEMITTLIITNHAKKRIKQRFKCHDSKQQKVVIKAWSSKNRMSPALTDRILSKPGAVEGDIYRYYLVHVFIFRKASRSKNGENKIALITLFNPNIYNVK